MRVHLLLFASFCILVSVSCGSESTSQGDIIGTWILQTELTKERNAEQLEKHLRDLAKQDEDFESWGEKDLEGLEIEINDQIRRSDAMWEKASGTTITFVQDSTFVGSTPSGEVHSGRWEIRKGQLVLKSGRNQDKVDTYDFQIKNNLLELVSIGRDAGLIQIYQRK